MTSWLEWGTLGHAILWLPASLWAIEKYLLKQNTKYLILNTIFLALSLLAGHLQISLYVIFASLAYFIFRTGKQKPQAFKRILLSLALFSLPFLLIAFQLIPSLELYLLSPRSSSLNPDWFKFFRIPIEYLITFIAPDFFGNPTTRNQWGNGSYVEMMGYVGLVPAVFALGAIKDWLKGRKENLALVKFFTLLVLVSLLLSLRTPVANVLLWLRLPIFASSSPARIIGLISFSLALLAGIGLDSWLKLGRGKLPSAAKLVAGLLGVLWVATFISVPVDHIQVARRNLIIPTVIFIAFLIIIFGSRFLQKIFKNNQLLLIVSYSLFILSAADLFRFHHKFTPYILKEYFYPTFGIRQKLKNFVGIERTFGLFDSNLNLPFEFATTEGYEPLPLSRYTTLINAQSTGIITPPSRSSQIQIGKNEPFTIPLINLLAARFVIQPTVHGSAPWELHLWEYPGQFDLLYDDGNYQIFQNQQATARFFLTTDYTIQTKQQQIIDDLLQNNPRRTIDGEPSRTIILEQEPELNIVKTSDPGEAKLVSYSPNQVDFEISSPVPSILYLSDNIYPGWRALIDDQPTAILRANFSFRAVPVSPGSHRVSMQYQPSSFTIGLIISTATLVGVIIWSVAPLKRQRVKS